MMTFSAALLMQDFAIISGLIFIAKIVRIKLTVIQRLYIPTGLLAGLLALVGGKYFLNILPFSSSIGEYPSVLIIVLFASLLLGQKSKVSIKQMMNDVGDTFLVSYASDVIQYGVFILFGILIVPLIFHGINPGFGLMLPAGFMGGHGSAVAIGTVFADYGWNDATIIGQTFATIGMLIGIIGGVLLINVGIRCHYTSFINSIDNLPEDLRTGIMPKEQQQSFGLDTINSMSLDTLSWHCALLCISVGGAYFINNLVVKIWPAISIPLFGLGLICSLIVTLFLKIMRLEDTVDRKVISHIGSCASDYLIAFAIASINITIVGQYLKPIIFLASIGIAWLLLWQFIVPRHFFTTYWFERGMYIYGFSSGVVATAVILLRICDPEFKSGILEDFGVALVFISFVDIFTISVAPLCIISGHGILFACGCLITGIISLIICKAKYCSSGKPSVNER